MAKRFVPENLDSMPDSACVSVREVAGWKGVSVNTIWRWVRENRLPPPQKIGPNCTRFVLGHLRAAERQVYE